jgi:hypothetical protein
MTVNIGIAAAAIKTAVGPESLFIKTFIDASIGKVNIKDTIVVNVSFMPRFEPIKHPIAKDISPTNIQMEP